MPKSNSAAAPAFLKEIRASLEARAEEKVEKPRAGVPAPPKSPLRALGVRSANVKNVAREFFAKNRANLDYDTALGLVEAALARKIREEILVSLDILERFRKDFDTHLFGRLEKWSPFADDLEVAEALGTRIAGPALALDPAKMAMVRKWARLKSVGRRRLALLSASALVTEGRRDAAPVLDMCEYLLNEDHPVLVSGVASLLRETTKVDAKAVQDFLFRRSIDGNPDILRAGSENLDAARRAALIAKLEAQAGLVTATPAAGK